MRYLLDTDHISILQRGEGAGFDEMLGRIAGLAPDDLAFSIISLHEQVAGANALIARGGERDVLRGYRLLADILRAFSAAPVLPFDEEAVAAWRGLREARLRLGTMDLRIASIALTRRLVLVTGNRRDFERVPGLVIEDWTG